MAYENVRVTTVVLNKDDPRVTEGDNSDAWWHFQFVRDAQGQWRHAETGELVTFATKDDEAAYKRSTLATA
jgi:hypothetical protein